MSQFTEYDDFDALGLAELVAKRQVSPVEVVAAAIERIERLNPQLNAVICKLYDGALARARRPEALVGPLASVPFLMKDLLSACESVPFTSGSRY